MHKHCFICGEEGKRTASRSTSQFLTWLDTGIVTEVGNAGRRGPPLFHPVVVESVD